MLTIKCKKTNEQTVFHISDSKVHSPEMKELANKVQGHN